MESKSLVLRRLIIAVAVAGCATLLPAEQISCAQVHAMAQMTRVKSTAELQALKGPAGSTYLAHLVFAFRDFQIHPSRITASAVLGFLPQDDSHREDWYALSGWICDKEETADVTALARLQDRMSHEFAKAIIILPDQMYQYISYPIILGLDPHDDYAEQMESVCRTKSREFKDAVNKLPEKDKGWFLRTVLNPESCHALAHPEAE